MAASAGFLDNCEHELLHLSGQVQDHGALLVLDQERRVTHVSQNVGRFIGGKTPESILADSSVVTWIPELDRLGEVPGQRHCVGARSFNPKDPKVDDPASVDALLDWTLIRGEHGTTIVEFSPHQSVRHPHTLREGDSRDALHCLRSLADLLDHERYMFYVFRRDEDGEVEEELCTTDEIGTYKGLRFPASDIPRIARALYEKNPFRLIPDSRSKPVDIYSKGPEAPDLTYSDLRSVSPAHRAYMENMGIVSSLSVPVLVQGSLKGLISAHSRHSVHPSQGTLSEVVKIVERFALGLSVKRAHESLRSIDRASWWCDSVLSDVRDHSLPQVFPSLAPALEEELEVDGVILFLDGQHLRSEHVPTEFGAELLSMAQRQTQLQVAFESFESLGRTTLLGDFAGALFLTLVKSGRVARLVLLRKEHPHEVTWGGNPNKPPERVSVDVPISPRKSFEEWVERRRGHCRPWERSTLLMTHRIRQALQALDW